jgi:site-specific DNA-methyltransferase (adenine-specific)
MDFGRGAANGHPSGGGVLKGLHDIVLALSDGMNHSPRIGFENGIIVNFSALRQEAGLELLDAATEFSASIPQISRWETGADSPPPNVINSLKGIAKFAQQPNRDIAKTTTENVAHEGAIRNVLFEGDCLEVLNQIPSASVNLILCDLPYGTTQNRWDSVIDLNRLWAHYKRVLAAKGVVVLTAQGVFTAKLILSNEDWFKYKIVWEKSKSTNFLNAKKQPLRKHEDICVFYKEPATYNPQMQAGEPYDKGVRKNQLSGSYGDFSPAHVRSDGARYPNDVVYFKTAESEAERTVWHPTQKPVGLGRYLVRTYSNEGDIVLDNAFGSGSFLVAAAMEKRRFIGIERNIETHLFKNESIDYVDLASRRLTKVGAIHEVERDQRNP